MVITTAQYIQQKLMLDSLHVQILLAGSEICDSENGHSWK